MLEACERRSGADRRSTDQPVPVDLRNHGDRREYQRGCTCTPCRAANARYQASFRRAKLTGTPLPGQRVPAARTHKLMLMLRVEWFSNGDVARLLGWHGNYGRVYHAATVTLRTAQAVERLHEERVA